MSDLTIPSADAPADIAVRRPKAWQIPFVFVWFGLASGFAQVAVHCGLHWYRGHHLFFNENFLWMTPLAEAVVFAALSLPLVILAAVFRGKISLSLCAGFAAFLAAHCFLSVIGSLMLLAVLLLSLGISIQTARWADRNPVMIAAIIRRSLLWLLAATAVLAVGVLGYRRIEEAAAWKRLPAPPEDRPNVLWVVLDTVRADALRVYGNQQAQTPSLQRFANRSVVFDRAVAPASWTLPSHASMFTGRYPNELSTDWLSPLDDRYPTVAEVLRDQGFATAGFVANYSFCSRPAGVARGFIHYEDFPLSIGEFLKHSWLIRLMMGSREGFSCVGMYNNPSRKSGRQVTDDFLDWLKDHQDRPFFAFLNYLDAHDPYLPDKLVGEDRPLTHDEKILMRNWWQMEQADIGPEEMRLARACYDSMIHYLDRQMGRLLDGLEAYGLRDNTIVIITSDHGEHFGEHGLCYHGNSVYRPLVHVPLIIGWTNRLPAGVRVDQPVTLRDLAATVVDLTAAENGSVLPGNSLAACWRGDRPLPDGGTSPLYTTTNPHPRMDIFPHHRQSPATRGPQHALLENDKYVIRFGDDQREMYDFATDPQEETNLADVEQYHGELDRIGNSLQRFLDEHRTDEQIAEPANRDPKSRITASRESGRNEPQP